MLPLLLVQLRRARSRGVAGSLGRRRLPCRPLRCSTQLGGEGAERIARRIRGAGSRRIAERGRGLSSQPVNRPLGLRVSHPRACWTQAEQNPTLAKTGRATPQHSDTVARAVNHRQQKSEHGEIPFTQPRLVAHRSVDRLVTWNTCGRHGMAPRDTDTHRPEVVYEPMAQLHEESEQVRSTESR